MEMTFEPVWNSLIAWYLFLAGMGGGAFATSAFLHWRSPQAKGMRKIGHFIAPVVVAIGLVLLMLDAEGGLHNPLRFALLLHNPTSVMTWGVVFLACFMIVALIAAILDLLKRDTPRWLDIVGAVLGVCVAMYTGALLGVCNTFPLWNSALLPILFLVSAMSAGAAAVLLISAFAYPKELELAGNLKKAHFWLPIAEIVLIASLLFITAHNTAAGSASVWGLLTGEWAVPFWLGLVVVGLVIPTAIETFMLFIASHSLEQSATGRYISVVADVAMLIGGFMLRYLVVMAALPISIS